MNIVEFISKHQNNTFKFSKAEIRRFIMQGAIKVNDIIIDILNYNIVEASINEIKIGKKIVYKRK